jgi:hypothetical protein
MKKLFYILLIALGFSINSCSNSSPEKKSEKIEEKILYQCPMDCEKGKTYDKPGQCSVCGMDFEKVETTPNQTGDTTHQN